MVTDKPLQHPGPVVYVEANSPRPKSPTVMCKRQWYKVWATGESH